MDDYNSYLAHHGIPGQKHGIRRYQNYDGSLTEEGRIRYGVGKPRKSLKQKIVDKKQAYKEKHAKTPEQEKAELKEYLRKHPKKLPKYNHELTQEEANEIISNIQFDRKLKDIRKEEINRGFDAIKNTSTKLATVAGFINQSINVYNNVASVYNLMYDLSERNGADMTNRKKLPKAAGGGGGQQNK